jgi:hypothetical protein
MAAASSSVMGAGEKGMGAVLTRDRVVMIGSLPYGANIKK